MYQSVKKVGIGRFGQMYEGLFHQEAIDFLITIKSGEMMGALSHPDIEQKIDVVWGESGERGYGLAHILEKHPEVVNQLSGYVAKGKIYRRTKNRIQLEIIVNISKNTKAISIVRLDFNNVGKMWLLTAFKT